MPSSPTNVYTAKTANSAAKVRVFVGPADGDSDSFTESFTLRPLEVMRVAGSRPDYAIFEFDADAVCENRDAAKTVTPDDSEISFNRQIYVEVHDAARRNYYDPDTDETYKFSTVIFWGELLTETLQVDPNTQRITVAARVADYHFGDVLEGELQYDPVGDSYETVPVDPIFNPLIDGVVEDNKSASYGPNNIAYPVWVDPESVRTAAAREVIEDALGGVSAVPEAWHLQDIANTLSQWLLGSEEFITATAYSQSNLTLFQNAPEVKNLQVRRGSHLNKVLDSVLVPYGFDWWLDPAPFDPDNSEKPSITFFRRGEGVFTDVLLQASGEDLDLAETNTSHVVVKTDVGNLANEMRGWGSFEKKELTIPLERGWADADDSLTAEDCRRSDSSSAYNSSNKKEAWRLWAANEAGDYIGTRTSITTHLDLSNEFTLYIPRRRMVEDCLTLDSNGKRRVPYLEYSTDAGSSWAEVPPEWGWVILQDQIGVQFTGDIPPEDLIDAGSNAQLRLTCTVSGDARLNSTSSPSLDESPSLRTVPLFLNVSDRYHKRSVQATGTYASTLAGDANGADEADDATDLQTFLVDTLENEVSAEMKCDFRLHGIHLQYQISDVLTYISGREIYLNRNKGFSEKFVQVYGIRWDFQQQTTELIVEDVEG